MAETWSNVDSTTLGEEDFQDVKAAVSQLTGVWKCFGSVLGLLPSAINDIKVTMHADPVRCLDEVLERWLKQNYNTKRFGSPSWRQLVKAVENNNGGEDPELAKKIAALHPIGKENTVVKKSSPKLQPVSTKLNIQQQIHVPNRSCLQHSAVSSSTQAEPPCKQVTVVVPCQPQDESDHPQLPTMTGGVLHKDITLHDPIMFESEGAVKHSDVLRDQANKEADCIEITRHPEDVQVRVNDTVTLSCEAKNKAGKELVYEWFRGDKKVGCGPSYQFKVVQRAKYYCRVSQKDNYEVFVKSRPATITVVSLRFTIQPQNVNGYVGERVILWCHAENITSPEENITYDWLKSDNKEGPFKPCPGSGEVLVIDSLTDKHPGYYKCQALTTDGLITSDTAYVGAKLPGNTNDVKLPEICFTKQPHSWALEPERSFTLICEATASKGDVTYQWIKDGSVLPEEQKSELKRMSAKLSDCGSYYCLVRTVEGGAVALSDTARVEMCKIEEGHYVTAPTNWKRGKHLGSGACAEVYICHDQDTGRELAVKMVDIVGTESLQMHREVQMLDTELQLLKKLRHERIVTYYGTGIVDGKMCIFMEFMPGRSVSQYLEDTGALTETLTRKYTKQILEGVAYLHDNKIVHRDIKGGNILRDCNGNIKLADFGASKQLQTIHGGLKSVTGTPYWMAPEVIKSEPYTEKADIWSLGATVVEMLTGHPPWHECNPYQVIFKIGSLNEDARPNLPPDCSEHAEHFVQLCFKKDKSQRPSALELLDTSFVAKTQTELSNTV